MEGVARTREKEQKVNVASETNVSMDKKILQGSFSNEKVEKSREPNGGKRGRKQRLEHKAVLPSDESIGACNRGGNSGNSAESVAKTSVPHGQERIHSRVLRGRGLITSFPWE